jgi:hypothetical protein
MAANRRKFLLTGASVGSAATISILFQNCSSTFSANGAPTANSLQSLANSAGAAAVATRAAIKQTSIPADQNFLAVAGFDIPGDGGGALYRRVDSPPSHNLKVQSKDGAWWELSPENGVYNIKQAGAVGDNTADDTQAIADVIAAAPSGSIIFVPPGTYKVSGDGNIFHITKKISIQGAGRGSLIRSVGSGHLLVLDGSSYGTMGLSSGVSVSDISLATEAGGGNALQLIQCHRTQHGQIWIPSCGGVGILLDGSLYNTFTNPTIYGNIRDGYPGNYVSPKIGIQLGVYRDTAAADHDVHYSGHNTIITPEITGLTDGTAIYIGNGAHNTILGGALAANKSGLWIDRNQELNTVQTLVTEGNSQYDIYCGGQNNNFINCQAKSSTAGSVGLMLATAPSPYVNHTNHVRGGRFYSISIQPGTIANLIDGIELLGTIQDQGTGTIITNVWLKNTAAPFGGTFVPNWYSR